MGRHVVSSSEVISTHPIGRALALPAKGQRGRRTALTGYGLLTATVFGTLTYASVQDDKPIARSKPAPGVVEEDAYVDHAAPGYLMSYFDGAGGIAGVPLTEEQRQALIREAKRRGLSTQEAYALAYGDGARIYIRKDGTVRVDTSDVVVPNHPVYRKLAPREVAAAQAPGAVPVKGEPVPDAAGKANGNGQAKAKKPAKAKQKPGKSKETGEARGQAEPEGNYYPSSGSNHHENEKEDSGLKSVLPPVLEEVVDKAADVTEFLSKASPGEVTVVGPVQQGNRVMMTMSAPLAEDLTVKTTIAAPLEVEDVRPVVTTVAVNADTGEVVAKEKDTCDNVDDVPTVAIGQVVDVVLEAREEMGPEVPVITPATVDASEVPAEQEIPTELVSLETPVREEELAAVRG